MLKTDSNSFKKVIEFEKLGEANLIQNCIYKGGNNNIPFKDDPLSNLFKFKNFKGIANQGGFRKACKEKEDKSNSGELAFVLIVDTGREKEWKNQFDVNTRIFTYYGDNRKVGNDIFNTKKKGNQLLLDLFTKAYSSDKNERIKIAPIFIFKSTGIKCDKEFLGIGIPGGGNLSKEEALQRKRFESADGSFENYVARFTILDLKEKNIKKEWLYDLKIFGQDAMINAPLEWKKFIENGIENLEDNIINKEIENIDIINEVERYIRVRMTQGKFRDGILKRDKKCVICGLEKEDLLIANHIKAWKDSNEEEKIDPDNGLLLCPNHDKLFDKGYITFCGNGNILISEQINMKNYELLNVDKSNNIKINMNQKKYMKFHFKNIFRK